MSVWDQLVGQEQQVQVLQKAASAARQIVCQRGSGNDDTGLQGLALTGCKSLRSVAAMRG